MKKGNDLGKDPILPLVMRLAIPAMFAQFVNVLYSIVDRMFVGNIPIIGDLALAGVGVCGPIVTFLSSFGTLVGIGGSILMAMKLGEKKQSDAEDILANSFIMLVSISIILTILFILFKTPMIYMFGGSASIFTYADTYLTIYTCGTFFALLAMGLNYFITAQGFAMIGMFTVISGALINIILDAIFIFVFNMGVAGAAIATVIAQFFSCAFAFYFLCSKKTHVKIHFKHYSFSITKKIIKMGISPFVIIATDSIIIIIMNTVLQKYGGADGDMLVTCNTIIQSYLLLITGPLLGITGGPQAIISFNYGACQIERVKKCIKYVLIMAISYCTIMFFVSSLFSANFASMFTSNVEYVKLTLWGIRIVTLALIPMAFQYTLVDAFTALGNVKVALILSLFRKFNYTWSTLLLPFLFTAKDALFSQPIADTLGASLTTFVFYKIFQKYLDARVIAYNDEHYSVNFDK